MKLDVGENENISSRVCRRGADVCRNAVSQRAGCCQAGGGPQEFSGTSGEDEKVCSEVRTGDVGWLVPAGEMEAYLCEQGDLSKPI